MTALDQAIMETIHGVSLPAYAGVQAGLAEGLEIVETLAREGVEPGAWPEAERGWGERLLDDLAAGGSLHDAYDASLAAAQERYARPLPPLDTELRSWLDLVRVWSTAHDPMALLAELALRPSDMIRLHRAWSRRLALEPALRLEAKAILEEPPSEMPSVKAPAIRGHEVRHPPACTEAAQAEPPDTPSDPALPTIFAPLPNAVFSEPDALTGDAPPRAAPSPPAVRAPHVGLSETSASMDLKAFVPALPFQSPPTRPSVPIAAPLPRRPPPALGTTSLSTVAPKVPALPFGSCNPPPSPPPPALPPPVAPTPVPPSLPPALVPRRSALSKTSAHLVIPKGPLLPFAKPVLTPTGSGAAPQARPPFSSPPAGTIPHAPGSQPPMPPAARPELRPSAQQAVPPEVGTSQLPPAGPPHPFPTLTPAARELAMTSAFVAPSGPALPFVGPPVPGQANRGQGLPRSGSVPPVPNELQTTVAWDADKPLGGPQIENKGPSR